MKNWSSRKKCYVVGFSEGLIIEFKWLKGVSMESNQVLKAKPNTINISQNPMNLCRRKKRRKTGW